MPFRTLTIALLLAFALAVPARAQTSAQSMYTAAMMREKTLRSGWQQMSDGRLPSATIRQARSVVASYEAIVRRYPASGYADNALWQAAVLEADLFARTEQEPDRRKAVSLFTFLAREYPVSRFAKAAATEGRRLEATTAPVPSRGDAASAPRPRAKPDAALPNAAAAQAVKAEAASSQPRPPEDTKTDAAAAGVTDALPGRAATTDAKTASGVSTIREIRRTILPEIVRVSIELDREVAFREEQVDAPARLLFDFPLTKAGPSIQDANWTFREDVVRKIRVGRHANRTTRVVLDLEGVSHYTVVTLANPFRILVDCERATTENAQMVPQKTPTTPRNARNTDPQRLQNTQNADPPRPQNASNADPQKAQNTGNSDPQKTQGARNASQSAQNSRDPDAHRPQTTGSTSPKAEQQVTRNAEHAEDDSQKADAQKTQTPSKATQDLPTMVKSERGESAKPRTADKPDDENAEPENARKREAGKAVDKPAAPPPADRNRFSMARQLGLGISRVVIDPGHGGHDPGAESGRTSESDIVLDIALRLERLLARERGVEVVMTRRSDVFVPLEERTAIANREQADLFLSIHANASRNSRARGIETYYLNFATNPEAEAVAARENAASGQTMNHLPDIIKAITLNSKLDESKDLAALVQQALARRLRTSNGSLKDLGVKQAPFVVLIGAAMPSVLAEVSFLTNKHEGQLLASDAYRQRIAEALCDAILRYKRTLKNAQALSQ